MESDPPILPDSIIPVDVDYQRPGMTCAYLVSSGGRAALIETGTGHSARLILAALDQKGISRAAVDYIIVTHVHLDHAGGAGQLLAELPNATLICHSRGVRHLVDPAKLVASSHEVYGAEVFARNFGVILPADPDRVVAATPNQLVTVGARQLRLMETPGHAYHHICIWDETSKGIFTGDAFGISYREFDTPEGIFLFPATTPTQFDPKAMHRTFDQISVLQPKWLYLTHFGITPFSRWLVDDLHRQIDRIRALTLGARDSTDRLERIAKGIERIFLSRAQRIGCQLPTERQLELLSYDIQLNAQGLLHWLENGTE